MKTESQDSVRSLFSLPPEEKIFDDFGCSLVDGLSYHGRIYLTENFICFNSHILGIKTKSVIPFFEIKEIKKLNNSIEILLNTKTKKTKQVFSSFTNFQVAYKRIKMICRNYLAKVNKKDKDNVSEMSKKIFTIILSDSDKSDDEDESDVDDNNISTGSGSANDNANKKISNVSSGNEKTHSRSSSAYSLKNPYDKEFPNSPRNNNDNVIESVINFPEIEENQYIATKHVIDMPVDEVFKKYYGNPSETQCSSFAFYSTLSDHYDINVSNWEKKQNESTSTTEMLQRVLTFSIKVEGIPLIDHSDCTKTQQLTIFKENSKHPELKYMIRGTSVSSGVPYASYFTIEDQEELYSYMNGTKTVIRVVYWNKLIKSTLFKNVILNSTKKVYPEEAANFINFIKCNGDSIIPYVPVISKNKKKQNDSQVYKLTHGIEKEQREANMIKRDNKIWLTIMNVIKASLSNKNLLIILSLFIVIFLLIFIIILEIKNNELIHTNMKLNENIKQLLLTIDNQNISYDLINNKSNSLPQ
jgi:hypothetical protein